MAQLPGCPHMAHAGLPAGAPGLGSPSQGRRSQTQNSCSAPIAKPGSAGAAAPGPGPGQSSEHVCARKPTLRTRGPHRGGLSGPPAQHLLHPLLLHLGCKTSVHRSGFPVSKANPVPFCGVMCPVTRSSKVGRAEHHVQAVPPASPLPQPGPPAATELPPMRPCSRRPVWGQMIPLHLTRQSALHGDHPQETRFLGRWAFLTSWKPRD